MTLFDSPSFEGHECVHAFSDEKTGLKCIVAVHSTARGPAAGGCRMWPYASAEDALEDALKLVPLMPLDAAAQRRLRATIRRWGQTSQGAAWK